MESKNPPTEAVITKALRSLSRSLASIRQNELLSESQFISFARDRGLPLTGVVEGEPGEFHRREWLSADGKQGRDLLFHPFRIYVLHQILSTRQADVEVWAATWNRTVDFAVLMEPIYWPNIVGHVQMQGTHPEWQKRTEKHGKRVSKLIHDADLKLWEETHAALRSCAAWLDQNSELYLLLRVSHWQHRKDLNGRIGTALWIRHLAEVLRRGFEDVHDVLWLEEDRAFGSWPKGARARKYGAERPLDDPLAAKWKLGYLFGLSIRSAVRWYVEGETELAAILFALTEFSGGQSPDLLGITIVDLHGEIAPKKGNQALRLRAALKEDIEAKRFSLLSFDRDVWENKRFVQRLVNDDLIVGLIDASTPDFEFANFSLEELVEIAARLDDSTGFEGDRLRKADCTGIRRGKDFENWYGKHSLTRRSLKGRAWGRALASYAIESPRRGNEERPLIRSAAAAIRGWQSNYDRQRSDFTFDLETFTLIERKQK